MREYNIDLEYDNEMSGEYLCRQQTVKIATVKDQKKGQEGHPCNNK